MGIFNKILAYFTQPTTLLKSLFSNDIAMPITNPSDANELIRLLDNELAKIAPSKQPLTSLEAEIVKQIQQETDKLNLNNITRTNAYLDFFKRSPEVHWAFLAHLVSRNGGWNMTDLKGSMLHHILNEKQKEDLFMFLESANASIFHDAYPQLRLYEESKNRGSNYFHLLPHFSVSSFMKVFWERFLAKQNSRLLTVALIINEQQYIQQNIVNRPYFQENVLDTLAFTLQEWLGFTNVLIPYKKRRKTHLAGITIRDFENVDYRIEVGKRLYGILFYKRGVKKAAFRFAESTPHTGSRADYWPLLFSADNKEHAKIYSPLLTEVWPNVHHTYPKNRDWFRNMDVMKHLQEIPITNHFDITREYDRKIRIIV